MQTNSSISDFIGKPVVLILVALIFFTLGAFFGNSFEFGLKSQKSSGNVHGRFGAIHTQLAPTLTDSQTPTDSSKP